MARLSAIIAQTLSQLAGVVQDAPGAQVPDLSHKDLKRINLEGKWLRRARLTGANLTEARLAGVDLVEADLFGADLSGADLNRADLTRAVARGARLRGANLNRCRLVETDLRGGFMLGMGGAKQIGHEFTDLTNCLVEFATASRAQMAQGCSTLDS